MITLSQWEENVVRDTLELRCTRLCIFTCSLAHAISLLKSPTLVPLNGNPKTRWPNNPWPNDHLERPVSWEPDGNGLKDWYMYLYLPLQLCREIASVRLPHPSANLPAASTSNIAALSLNSIIMSSHSLQETISRPEAYSKVLFFS